MDEYKIQLDRHVLKQLGSQLYGDTPSVISELVANSYDADARNVWITINTVNNNILVEDDGKGMTANDINEAFLNIGYDKRENNHTTALGRKIMGRKGIGKLAAFSLTNCVVVCSSKDGKKCGCIMDFKKITEGEERSGISPENICFSKSRLSDNGSGTRIELREVKKRVAMSYRFIVNRLIRTFDVNDDNFAIHIRQNNAEFKLLRRADLDFFSIMDTILVIGEEHKDKLLAVSQNEEMDRYKFYTTYEDYIKNQTPRSRNRLESFPYKIEVEDAIGNETQADFSLSGWIGTVASLPKLKELTEKMISETAEEADIITISDNRISLYSRGKLGEYDILPKIKNNRNSEAYVIGELYVDLFEDDNLADMAISNRRGYDEGDNRYIETIRIAKRLLGYIVDKKDAVMKQQKSDQEQKDIASIKEHLERNNRSKQIFEEKLSEEDREIVQEENYQFARAITSSKTTKKIFISHSNRLKTYGQFIVDVLEDYGIDVCSDVIFTSDPRLGVPQGRDIYDYLKECFREDLMVVFLYSKAFYDSNVCISEAGAAWATNQNCMNAIIDIAFGDIEKPSNNSLSSIRLSNLQDKDQQVTLFEFFSTIIKSGLRMSVDERKLKETIQKIINSEKYNDQIMNNPEVFIPQRKFLPIPLCPTCGNQMKATRVAGSRVFACTNVSCKEQIPFTII